MQTQRFLSLVRALLCAYRLIVDGLRGDLVTNRATYADTAFPLTCACSVVRVQINCGWPAW